MKKIVLILVFASLTLFSFAQKLDRCGYRNVIEHNEKQKPGFEHLVDEQFEIAKSYASSEATVYTINVVVHIVYNTANQNLADSVIFNAIEHLSKDFQRLNADTVNMRPIFAGVKGNPKIKFVLASVDPNGNPTTGITRTSTTKVSFGSQLLLSLNMTDAEKVKSTADGGRDPWDQNRYLNIWVCNLEIFPGNPALFGYATPPSGLPNWDYSMLGGISDGVVMQYQYIARNNPNPGLPGEAMLGRTLDHEVGHYLGLRHIWADDQGCTAQDGISDTPNAGANSSASNCDLSSNTCVDNIMNMDLPDMAENYMDYSPDDCMNSFTQGQADLMRGVLNNQRIGLIQGSTASIYENGNSLSQLSFYPNPVTDQVNIKAPLAGTIEFLDLRGTSLKQTSIKAGYNRITIHDLAEGVYIIRMIAPLSVQTNRIVVFRP